MKKHLELEIKTLQNAPRDADKLRKLLELKQRQKEEEAMHIEDTQRLVTEIEMLMIVEHWNVVDSLNLLNQTGAISFNNSQ